jgi:hypothetical protein
MDNISSGLVIEPATPPPPGGPAVIAQRAPFLGWMAKHLVLPLTPFFVGSAIRIVRTGELSASAFDPAELSFSLAMFCILGVVAAHRIHDREYRDIAFVVFVIGVAVFMSMFSFSVAESARLSTVRDEALIAAVQALKAEPKKTPDEIALISREKERQACERTVSTVLSVVVVLGVLFVGAGFAARDRYGLGEE